MSLTKLGWELYQKLTNLQIEQEPIARVSGEHKTYWDLITPDKNLRGIILESFRQDSEPGQLPKVGDFIVYENLGDGKKVKVLKVLPRFSYITRNKKDDQQILAANINKLFIVHGLDQELNVSQLQRYAAMGISGNTEPIIVLNKTDQAANIQDAISKISNALPDLKQIQTSAKVGNGINHLQELIPRGVTAVFVGLSGAGKSSLINALLREEVQSIGQVGDNGKGRHTTTRRELLILPNEGIVIDTPGIRTLEQNFDEQTIGEIFSEIKLLAEQCKFRNCDHIKSQGCAVVAAVEQGKIPKEQYRQFLKLWSRNERQSNKDDLQIKLARRQKRKAKNQAYRKHLKKK